MFSCWFSGYLCVQFIITDLCGENCIYSVNTFIMWSWHGRILRITGPDSKPHGANMGPTWVLSPPGGAHFGPMNIALWGAFCGWNPPLTDRFYSHSLWNEVFGYLICCQCAQVFEPTIDFTVICGGMKLIWRHCSNGRIRCENKILVINTSPSHNDG